VRNSLGKRLYYLKDEIEKLMEEYQSEYWRMGRGRCDLAEDLFQ
jgi:hypothetical protein